MYVWLISLLILIAMGVIYALWHRAKQLQQVLFNHKTLIQEKEIRLQTKDAEIQTKDAEIQTKDAEIQTKDAELAKIKTEKATVEAKYHKKVKAAEVKKQNLAKYRARKKDTRTLQQQVEDIVGKGPKWLPHSCEDPSSHRIGKPKGGKGGGRSRPEKIHDTQDLLPDICYSCNTNLSDSKAYFVYDAIITELSRELDEVGAYEVLRLKNICHRIHRRKCPTCGRWVYPEQGLFANSRFGVGLICYVISRRILLNLTYKDILLDLQDHFGVAVVVSETAIIDWFVKFEEQIEGVYAQLEALIKEEEFVHIDETGMPMLGKNWWLWVVCTANLVLYHQSAGRAHKDIEGILKGFEGTIIADFFRAYEKFDANPHQKCLAHLLSSIIELMVKLEKENERMALKVQQSEAAIARVIEDSEALPGEKKRGRKPKAEQLTASQIALLDVKYQQNQTTLQQAERLGGFFRAPFKETVFGWKTEKTGRISRAAAENLLDQLLLSLRVQGLPNEELAKLVSRCEKFRSELFTYLDYEDMPPDNNRAERNLRKFTKQRKISGGFRSPEVGKSYVTYLSLFMTCKMNDRDFPRLLREMLSGNSVDLRAFLFPNP